MVSHTGAAMGADGLRSLGLPRPIHVELSNHDLSVTITRDHRQCSVAHIEEVWRIAEAWWREHPVARTYVRMLMDEGRVLTCFHDDSFPPGDGWYEQRY